MAQLPPRPGSPSAGGLTASRASVSAAPSVSASNAGAPPTTYFLGRYRVVEEIGTGGMASVHLARMDGPGGFQKWVALKRIHPHLVEDDQFVDMFLDEARIAAGISHANVAQVFDLGRDDNTYWIAMEYLHGEPLREVMRVEEERGLRISPQLAARIGADAAEGLHAAHELRGKNGQLLGLVHRDVTPHNLFLTYDGYTKVVDFGIAKVADRLSSTRAGTLKGKLAYMSPEQVRGVDVDRTTDVFALGVVLWEVTTNQRLFRMDTDLDTLERVQACVVPPPSSVVPGFPKELEGIILRALAKQKRDRYQTARELSRALQAFLMRSGAFMDSEGVANFMRSLFADRIPKREAHLAWASEVTSMVSVDRFPMSSAPPVREPSPPRDLARPVAPEPGATGGANIVPTVSLADLNEDDEDLPTTVAMREDLEAHGRLVALARPAGGLPPPNPPPPRGPLPSRPMVNAGPQVPVPFGFSPPQPIATPSQDLGATVALPPSLMGASSQTPAPQFSAQRGPQFGAPPPNAFAPVGGAQFAGPHPSVPHGPGFPFESGMAAPPAPLADPRHTAVPPRGSKGRGLGMVIATVSLTALCVGGIGGLVYLKLVRSPNSSPAVPTSSVSTLSSLSGPEAAVPSVTGEPRAAIAIVPAAGSASAAVSTPVAPVRPVGLPKEREAGKEESGYLTIVCNPYCDDVVDQGQSLGPSPVVRRVTKPGAHRLTLKNGSVTKVISVIVVSGQVSVQRVAMQ